MKVAHRVTHSPWTHSHTMPTIPLWAIGRLLIPGSSLDSDFGSYACLTDSRRRNLLKRLALTSVIQKPPSPADAA